MKKKYVLVVGFFILCLASELSSSPLAGSFLSTAGGVQLIREGNKIVPFSGMPLRSEDKIRTEEGGACVIGFLDGSRVSVSENTEVSISDARFQRLNRHIKLGISRGKIRSVVKHLERGSSYEVLSPTAVAGVRGTDFFTQFDDARQETSISVVKGRVEVRDRSHHLSSMVRPGQRLRIGQRFGKPKLEKFDLRHVKKMKHGLRHAKIILKDQKKEGVFEEKVHQMAQKRELIQGKSAGERTRLNRFRKRTPLPSKNSFLGAASKVLTRVREAARIPLLNARRPVKKTQVRKLIKRRKVVKHTFQNSPSSGDATRFLLNRNKKRR